MVDRTLKIQDLTNFSLIFFSPSSDLTHSVLRSAIPKYDALVISYLFFFTL